MLGSYTRVFTVFLNPQIFLSGLKNFHDHTQRIQIELSRPQVGGFTLISSAGLKSDLRLMRNCSHHFFVKKKKKNVFADKTVPSSTSFLLQLLYWHPIRPSVRHRKKPENVRATAWQN